VRSGFATLIGRPNVGKSTLLNHILGTKVSIVSDKPQTTRAQVRGVLNRPDTQLVFVDTPGIHKPRTPLGARLNEAATAAIPDVDAVVLLLDAKGGVGTGDKFIAERAPRDAIVAVNKVDKASKAEVAAALAAAAEFDLAEYFPISARTGDGVEPLVQAIIDRLEEGPAYYPDGVVTDVPEAFWVAELVREQLLAVVRDEMPHSIACRVTEWEWPRVRCEILVERDSQKGIVIGKGAAVLKRVGTAVREQVDPGMFLELHVKVDKEWQRRPDRNLEL